MPLPLPVLPFVPLAFLVVLAGVELLVLLAAAAAEESAGGALLSDAASDAASDASDTARASSAVFGGMGLTRLAACGRCTLDRGSMR